MSLIKPKPNGRPKTYLLRMEPSLSRVLFRKKLKDWYKRYNKTLERLRSQRMLQDGDEDALLQVGAELAMIVLGRRKPDKKLERKGHLRDLMPIDVEAMHFLRYVRHQAQAGAGGRRGRKLDPELAFKTALSFVVARKAKMPRGGSNAIMPSSREIAEIWEVLFGEVVNHESIRSRLPSVMRLCVKFHKEKVFEQSRPHELNKHGKAFLKKREGKKRRASRAEAR